MRGNVLRGRIAYVDHFGNLISNVSAYHVRELQGVTRHSEVSVRLSDVTVGGLVRSYADGKEGVPGALINSNGQLEVFLREGNAAESLTCGIGDPIELS